ncbi:hypothetical protein JVU11DRAFT_7392 [Chiua virens]|nr:hypothetical protein JVU11DRAFT_7392 [Chiua virens]
MRDFWQQLLEGGASAFRFHNQPHSAQAVIEPLLGATKAKAELLLQRELVEQQKPINETSAGKVVLVHSRLQQLLAEQRRTLKELKEQADACNDLALAKSLQEEYDKINAQLQKTVEEMEEMKVPFTKRIFLWLFGRKSTQYVLPAASLVWLPDRHS